MAAKPRRMLVVVLRLLAAAATLAATIVMATSHETISFFGVTLEAKYQYTAAFEVLLIVNAGVTAYSLLVLFIPPNTALSYAVVPADVLVALLLTGTLAAAGSVAYVGRTGNSHAGWLPICGQIPDFCNRVTRSLACAFAGVLLYTTIVLYSVHPLFVHPDLFAR